MGKTVVKQGSKLIFAANADIGGGEAKFGKTEVILECYRTEKK